MVYNASLYTEGLKEYLCYWWYDRMKRATSAIHIKDMRYTGSRYSTCIRHISSALCIIVFTYFCVFTLYIYIKRYIYIYIYIY